MARVKMNNEYRTKISNQVRNALDNDKLNSKREAYQTHLEYTRENYPIFFSEAKASGGPSGSLCVSAHGRREARGGPAGSLCVSACA